MKEKGKTRTGEYASLQVEVIRQMDHCPLICFEGRKLFVDTADLGWIKVLREAA